MLSDERIKVVFKRVYVRNSADGFGSGEFHFRASVDGTSVGEPKRRFTAREGTWSDLPAAHWSHIVNVRDKDHVVVRFEGKDEDWIWDDNLGSVQHTLRPAWRQRTHRQGTEYFLLEWEVFLAEGGSFARHPPDAIFACREHLGSVRCTTMSGARITARLEFHPVRPMPTAGLPPRAAFPAGTAAAVANPSNAAGTNILPGSPINVVANPPVIPILSPPGPGGALPANAPPRADATTAARIEYTWYRPSTLAFTDSDPRLEWSYRSIAGGGAVAFLPPAVGLKVFVYGTHAGEVVLDVKMRGALLASYRALVMAERQIPCRINILNGPPGARPRATPGDCQNHLAVANRYLRQLALALVPDANATRTDGATATGTPGIFRISVSRGTTRRVNSGVISLRATRLNYRPNVMNFAYIHSERNPLIGGAATDFPASKVAAVGGARPQVTDSGTPSDSWVSPTGIAPDAAAGVVTMQLINAYQRPGHPRLFAMFLCDTLGDPATPAGHQQYAKSMVHELCHILNLGHRIEGPDPTTPTGLVSNGVYWDGLSFPPQENIMFWQGAQPICQDLDIIQARAARQSPLVPP